MGYKDQIWFMRLQTPQLRHVRPKSTEFVLGSEKAWTLKYLQYSKRQCIRHLPETPRTDTGYTDIKSVIRFGSEPFFLRKLTLTVTGKDIELCADIFLESLL